MGIGGIVVNNGVRQAKSGYEMSKTDFEGTYYWAFAEVVERLRVENRIESFPVFPSASYAVAVIVVVEFLSGVFQLHPYGATVRLQMSSDPS